MCIRWDIESNAGLESSIAALASPTVEESQYARKNRHSVGNRDRISTSFPSPPDTHWQARKRQHKLPRLCGIPYCTPSRCQGWSLSNSRSPAPRPPRRFRLRLYIPDRTPIRAGRLMRPPSTRSSPLLPSHIPRQMHGSRDCIPSHGRRRIPRDSHWLASGWRHSPGSSLDSQNRTASPRHMASHVHLAAARARHPGRMQRRTPGTRLSTTL